MSRVLQREEEQAFHDRIESLGLVQSADLEACLAQQKKSMKKAVVQSLPDLLVERGFLSLYQVKKLLEGLETTRVYCLSCRKRFEVPRETFESKAKLACTHCEAEVPRGKSSGAMAEDLVLDHPTHLGNKLLGKILVANEIVGKKDLEKCQEEARRRSGNVDLGRILVEKNLLSLNKLKVVLKERDRSLEKHHPNLEKLRKDVKLARLLVKRDLVPVSRINECLLEQAKIEKDDKKADLPRLRDLLVDRGFLTTYQIEVVIPKLSDKVLPGFESRPELFEASVPEPSDESEAAESSELLVAAANPRQAAEADEEAFEDSVDALLDDDSSELDEILDDSSDFDDASSEADDLDESEEVDLDASADDGASDDFDLDESESGPGDSVEEPVRPAASSIADPLAASESFVPDAGASSLDAPESSVASSLGEAPPEIQLPDEPAEDLDDSSLGDDSDDDAPAPRRRGGAVKDEPIDIDDEELFDAEDSLFDVDDSLADSSDGSAAAPAKRPAPRAEDDDDDDFEDDFDDEDEEEDDDEDDEEARPAKAAVAAESEVPSESGESESDEKPAPKSATARRRAARSTTDKKKKGLFGMFGGKKGKPEEDKETEELPSRRAARKGKIKGGSEDKPAAKRSPTRRTKR